MHRPTRRFGAIVAAVALVALVLAADGVAGPPRLSHLVPSRSGGGVVRVAQPPPTPISPNETFVITNGSLVGSSQLPGNGRNPFAGTYDPWNGNTYFADADAGSSTTDNVTVVSGPSRVVIATDPVGSGPLGDAGIGVDPDQGNVFVANSESASVSVINGTTERVQATVGVGLGPEAITYDPLLGDMVIADTESSSLSFLNVSTDRIDGDVSVGALPTGLVFDPVDGEVWVANSGSSSVSVIGAVSQRLIATVSLPGVPGAIAADPVSGDVYVANPSGGNVSVLNATSHAITYEIFVGYDPNAVVFDSQNADLYVPSGNGSYLSIINPRTHTAPYHVAVPGVVADSAFDPFNGEVYLTESGLGGVYVLRGTAGTPFAAIPTGRGTRGVVPDPSSGWVFVGDYNASALLVVNGTSNFLTAILPTSASPVGVAYESTSGEWFASDPQYYGGKVVEVNGLTDGLTATIPVGSNPQGIVDDPANGTVVVADAGSDQLSFISPGQERVVAVSYLPDSPSQIALDPSNQNLFVTDPMNSSVTEVNGTNGAVLGTVSVGQDPVSLAYDPIADAMVVANGASKNLTVLDARTGLATGSIPLNGSPGSLAYDPAVGELFVTVAGIGGSGPNFLVALGGATLSVVRSLVANPTLGALTYDPVQGILYLAEPSDSRIVAVDGSTDQVEGAIPVPGGASGLAFGGTPSVLCASEAGAGALAFLLPVSPAGFPVNFVESGLPGGAAWTVDLDGELDRSFTSTITFDLPNGTDYPFSLGVVLGYRAAPATGTLNVSGVAVLETIRFVVNGSMNNVPSSGFLGLTGYGPVWALGFLAVCVASVSLLLVRKYAPQALRPFPRIRLAFHQGDGSTPPTGAGAMGPDGLPRQAEGANAPDEDRDAAGRA